MDIYEGQNLTLSFQNDFNIMKLFSFDCFNLRTNVKNKEIYALEDTLKSDLVVLSIPIKQFLKNLRNLEDVMVWANTIRIKNLIFLISDLNNSNRSESEFLHLQNKIFKFLKKIDYFNSQAVYCIPVKNSSDFDLLHRKSNLSWYKGFKLMENIQNVSKFHMKRKTPNFKLNIDPIEMSNFSYLLNKFINESNTEELTAFIKKACSFFHPKKVSTVSNVLTVYVIVVNNMKGKIKIQDKGYLDNLWENETKYTIIDICNIYDKYSSESIERNPKFITNNNSALMTILLEHPICVYTFDNYKEGCFIRLYDKKSNFYAFGIIKDVQSIGSYEINECKTFTSYVAFLIFCDRDDILKQILIKNSFYPSIRLLDFTVKCYSTKTLKLLFDLGFVNRENAVLSTIENEQMRKEMIYYGCSMKPFYKFRNVQNLINDYFSICKRIQCNFSEYSDSISDWAKCAFIDDFARISSKIEENQTDENVGYLLTLSKKQLNSIVRDILDPYNENSLLQFCYNEEEIENLSLIKLACEFDCVDLFINGCLLYTYSKGCRDCIAYNIHITTLKSLLERNCLNILRFLSSIVFDSAPELLADKFYENLDYKFYLSLMKLDFKINSPRVIIRWLVRNHLALNWTAQTKSNLNFGLHFVNNVNSYNFFIYELFRYFPYVPFELDLIVFHLFRIKLSYCDSNIFQTCISVKRVKEQLKHLMKVYDHLRSIDICSKKEKFLMLSDLLLERNMFDIYRFCDPNLEKLQIETDNLYLKKHLFLQLAKIACFQFLESLLLNFIPHSCVFNILSLFSEYDILIIMSQEDGFRSFFDPYELNSIDCKIFSFFEKLNIFSCGNQLEC